MAGYKNSAYQYETSPRKVAPEYEPKKAKKKNINKTKKAKVEPNKNKELKPKRKLKPHAKTVLYVIAGFALLFALSYQNSLITASFSKNEDLKKQLNSLQKENAQLEISIQNNLNLANIEKAASSMLGMKKLDESQKVYVSLPKKDYVESASEQVVVTEEKSLLEQFWEGLTSWIN